MNMDLVPSGAPLIGEPGVVLFERNREVRRLGLAAEASEAPLLARDAAADTQGGYGLEFVGELAQEESVEGCLVDNLAGPADM